MQNRVINLLLIEDEPLTANIVRMQLTSATGSKFSVEHVSTLAAAHQRLAAGALDVVLLDLGLPDSAGRETFASVHNAAPSLPVVILSADNDEALALQLMREGAQDYLVKGRLDVELLSRVVRFAVERKQIEQMLAEERDRLRALIEALPDHIYLKDKNSRFVLANNSLLNFLGLTSLDQLIGKTDFDFFPQDAANVFYHEEQSILNLGQAVVNRESSFPTAEGRNRWLLTTKVPLRNSHGVVTGLVGINRDVTRLKDGEETLRQLNDDLVRSQLELLQVHENLKQAQTQLIQAEKLESVGRLAAGIAHEVKNPLAIMLMGVSYLEDTVPPGNPVTDGVFHDIRDAVERADTIVRELLDFATPRDLELAAEDLNSVIERALRLVRHELHKRRIEVTREFAPALPARRVDRIRIQQVFVNLFMNAAHAMPDGGHLTVRTFVDATGAIVAEILDTGIGIAAENLSKVFDPFFTTKPVGVGSGIGLSVAKGIISQHGGEMTLSNRPEGGVRVQITFHNGKETQLGS